MAQKPRAWSHSLMCAVALVIAFAASSIVIASDYPARPIRLIVPFGPGGITDIIARQVAKGLGERLGQPVIVENKPGAGHVLAMQTVATAQPDGYTILFGSNTGFTIAPHVYKNLGYDVIKSFTLIAPIYASPVVLLARPDFPANSLTEFVNLAKSKPNTLNYGSYGAGTSAHLSMEIFKKDMGIDVLHIPYKGDAGAIQALLSKDVDVAFITMFSAGSRIRSGELKAIGLFQSERVASLGSIQTTAEAGSKNADFPTWGALFVPAATPTDIVQRLQEATRSVTSQKQYQDFLRDRGTEPLQTENAKLLQFMHDQSSRIAPLVTTIGLKP